MLKWVSWHRQLAPQQTKSMMSSPPVILWNCLCTQLKEKISQSHECTRVIRWTMFCWFTSSWCMWINKAKHLMEGNMQEELCKRLGLPRICNCNRNCIPRSSRLSSISDLRNATLALWSVPLLCFKVLCTAFLSADGKKTYTVCCQKIDEAPTIFLSMHELESWLAKCIDLAAAYDCVGMVAPHKPWSALCTLCYNK